MKKAKAPKRISSRQRRLAQLQVKEYIDRYHPEFGDVVIDVSPSGAFASVREVRKKDR
jgi:hypothetical protein